MPLLYVEAADKAQAVSENGGRHWTLIVDDAVNADMANITSGDLVIYGHLVGVALTDYDTDNHSVCIDVAGGHHLPVRGYKDAAPTPGYVGDPVYFDLINGYIELANTDGVYVGRLLESVTAGTTDEEPGVMLYGTAVDPN